MNAMESLNKAQAAEGDGNYLEAIGHYNAALANFASAAINGDIKDSASKEEFENQLKYCMNCSETLKELQNEKEEQNYIRNVSHGDEKVVERIKSTLLSNKRSKVTFADVCGIENIKTDLKLAMLLPFQHPQLFLDGREPSRSFLFFGVRLNKNLILTLFLHCKTSIASRNRKIIFGTSNCRRGSLF